MAACISLVSQVSRKPYEEIFDKENFEHTDDYRKFEDEMRQLNIYTNTIPPGSVDIADLLKTLDQGLIPL